MMNAISYLPMFETGRTFVCSDIHGCFSALENKLKDVHFDPKNDRLISVGDLIDRGAESIRALEFLAKPWFYSVMGNHESMLLNILSGDKAMESAWLYEGGAWFYDQVNEAERTTWKEELSKLPILIEIETKSGRIGIVHADLPKEISWNKFVGLVQAGNPMVLSKAIRGRTRVSSHYCENVSGIWRIYCGHTVISEPRLLGNVYYIDTGAYMGKGKGSLTLIEITNVE